MIEALWAPSRYAEGYLVGIINGFTWRHVASQRTVS